MGFIVMFSRKSHRAKRIRTAVATGLISVIPLAFYDILISDDGMDF